MEEEIKKLKEEIETLKKQLKEMEDNHTHIHHHYAPVGGYGQQLNYQNPPFHWHNGLPCYQNPCFWC